MARKGTQGYFMLLGWAVMHSSPPVDHECLPYTRQPPLDCSIELSDLLVRLPHDAANSNLCEEMT